MSSLLDFFGISSFGYGAFSYAHAQLENVYQQKTFREEYIDFMNAFRIEFSEKYLFEWID